MDTIPLGYAHVAAFQSSDPGFLQYRGFGYLHCRVLLELQYAIEQLEGELDELDVHDYENGNLIELRCRSRNPVESAPSPDASVPARRSRPVILEDIRLKLMEYGLRYHSQQIVYDGTRLTADRRPSAPNQRHEVFQAAFRSRLSEHRYLAQR